MESYSSSSQISEKVQSLNKYIKPIKELEIGQSIAIPTSEINNGIVDALCESLTVSGKCVYVHVKHLTAFEVARIDNDFKRELFYLTKDATSKPNEDEIVGSSVDKMRKFLNDFEFRSVDEVSRTAQFDEKMKVSRVVPYAYIQRCLASTAPFKHYHKGGTDAIKMALRILVQEEVIEAVDSETARDEFGTKVRLYRIL